VSDPDLGVLAEAARNRGLKLVRSRVRTPGKRRFGKVGLTDASGRPVLGMDAKGPTAKPEEVEDYLRNLGARDWGASLDVAILPRKKRKPQPGEAPAAAQAKAKPVPKPKPKPKPQVRDAKPRDAAALVRLSALLGAAVDEKGVRKRVTALAKDGVAPLVATLGNDVVGVCAIERMLTIHREHPVGRISHLVVAAEVRGQGIGRMLTQAAEQRLRKLGCEVVEITSNDRLAEAHAFYRHMGYERTSIRFCKAL
jgi:ribosomal protein S18 acetylase RimI-like enzyme